MDEISKKDLVQADVWKDYSEQFEKKAFEEMSGLQSDNLLFVLLNIPLKQIENKSMLQLAIKQKSVQFLRNDGIRRVVNHSYQQRVLSPQQRISIIDLDLFHLSMTRPFKFYFSGQGYYWITGILFVLYYIFVCCYVYWKTFVSIKDQQSTGANSDLGLDITFWIMNLAFVLSEVAELFERGIKSYLFIGYGNQLDIVISVLWIAIFGVKFTFR